VKPEAKDELEAEAKIGLEVKLGEEDVGLERKKLRMVKHELLAFFHKFGRM
jgi:hypothetical protein